jgi:hypothetical protein
MRNQGQACDLAILKSKGTDRESLVSERRARSQNRSPDPLLNIFKVNR